MDTFNQPAEQHAVGPMQPVTAPHVQSVSTTTPVSDVTHSQSFSVVEKLKAYRASKADNETVTLPETGVVVSFPAFRSHGAWANALRLAKNKLDKAQVLYACKVCTFDGQKITASDYEKYIPMIDSNELLGRLIGGSDNDDGEDEGNGQMANG